MFGAPFFRVLHLLHFPLPFPFAASFSPKSDSPSQSPSCKFSMERIPSETKDIEEQEISIQKKAHGGISFTIDLVGTYAVSDPYMKVPRRHLDLKRWKNISRPQ
jgi:hypothetical protein